MPDRPRRRALVTGASHGLGAAIALGLARALGADVALHHSAERDAALPETANAAGRTAQALRGAGADVTVVDADLGRAGAPEAVVAAAGAVDILVLNASAQVNRPIEALDEEAIEREAAVNWRASLRLLSLVLPSMAERGWGRVLFIGSVQIARPLGVSISYAGLKAGMETVMRGLAVQYAPHGITCNTLSPGLIETHRSAEARRDREAWRARGAANNPAGRVSVPEDHVAAAVMLCSEGGSYVTGANLYVTGGGHLAYRPDQLGRR